MNNLLCYVCTVNKNELKLKWNPAWVTSLTSHSIFWRSFFGQNIIQKSNIILLTVCMPAQTQLSWVTLFNYRLLQSSRLLCTSQVSSLPSSTKFLESQLAGSALALVILSVTIIKYLCTYLKKYNCLITIAQDLLQPFLPILVLFLPKLLPFLPKLLPFLP